MRPQSEFPSSQCIVEVLNRQKEVRFTVAKESVADIVHAVLENESEQAYCVCIHFLSDRAMRQYHRRFFQDSSSTDCMSFPIDQGTREGGFRHLGDVFVCPKTALLYSNNSESLFLKEITLYVIHGMLHLLGYDDQDPKSRLQMRRQERSALAYCRKRGISLRGTIL